jgi:hypothetical protein
MKRGWMNTTSAGPMRMEEADEAGTSKAAPKLVPVKKENLETPIRGLFP